MREPMIQLNLDQYDELDYAMERSRYNKELTALWDHVEIYLGERMQDVVAFTWRDAYMTDPEWVDNDIADQHGETMPYSSHTHLNAVRLKNDDVIPMPLIAKPIIPERTMVTLKKIYS
jgi:hypothetical protein